MDLDPETGEPIGEPPVIHIGGSGRGECNPQRRLDGKTEGWGMQWYDVTCPKCRKLLRAKHPSTTVKWKRFVDQCSRRGAEYMREAETKAVRDVLLLDHQSVDTIGTPSIPPVREFAY